MKRSISIPLLALALHAGAQCTTGQLLYKIKVANGYQDHCISPSSNDLLDWNSGLLGSLPRSTFALASHTHTASQVTDFNSVGDARWSLLGHTHTYSTLTSVPEAVLIGRGLGLGPGTSQAIAPAAELGISGQTIGLRIESIDAKATLVDEDLLIIADSEDGMAKKSIQISDLLAGTGTVTDVSATSPVQSTGGTTPVISVLNSTGGNQSADAGKLLAFNTEGQIQGSSASAGLAAVSGEASGSGTGGRFASNTGDGLTGSSNSGIGVTAATGNNFGLLASNNSTTIPAAEIKNFDPTNVGPIAHFHADDNLGLVILNDGGQQYTSATGAATTRTNLGLVVGTNVQAQNANLQAVAGLTSAADKLPYFTGSGAAAVTDFRALGRTLLSRSTNILMRSDLGVVIGTDVQAQNANLEALSGLTGAASKGVQFTGAGTMATFDLTNAGKDLLDDASASAQRTTLGATTVGSNFFTATNPDAITFPKVAADNSVSFESASAYRTSLSLPTETIVRQASDATSTSTSLADVTGLSAALSANKDYAFEAYLMIECTSTSGGATISVNGPASPTRVAAQVAGHQSAGSITRFVVAYDDGTGASNTAAANTAYLWEIRGIIQNGANAGNMIIRFARNGSGTLTVRAGSYMRVTQLN